MEKTWRVAIVKRYRPHRYAEVVQHFDSLIDIVIEIARVPESCIRSLAEILGLDISRNRITMPVSMLVAIDTSSLDQICREAIAEIAKRSDIDDKVLFEKL